MRRKFVLVILLLLAGSLGLSRWRTHAEAASVTGKRAVLYYQCPMHPDHRSDKPGKAPCCGMDLVPVYANEANAAEQSGNLFVSREKQRFIGVRLGAVEESHGDGVFRTSGRVVPDEARVYRLTSKVDGWVRKLYPDSTGALVQKGQPLVSVYSKELQVAQQGYLFALNQLDRFRNGDEPDAIERLKQAVKDAVLNLETLGVSEDQIESIARDKRILQEVNLVAPAAGFITTRNVYADQRFDRGTELYRIVDIAHVWILADISDPQSRHMVPGAPARVSTPQLPTAEFTARTGGILPNFDANSRTLQLRLEAANPRFALRPDMYVDVEFAVRTPSGLSVPREAVIDSGNVKVVFVARDGGYFEPRQVRTGWRMGDRVEVVEGLTAGEQIVISGAFLIDSESRMHSVAAK
jgi:Cu(I)/Ag(I) efflux system membrane fusion protein